MDIKRIVVVGGGPAGLMAAIRAGQLNQDVTLIEKNPVLGKKLLLSGKGRCNLTNLCDLDSFLERFSGNGEFLRDAFKKLFNQDLINFFEERGLKLKVERQKRVFPETDSSSSVLEVLKKELEKNKVKIIYRAKLQDVLLRDGAAKGLLLFDGRVLSADKIILATGGVSYRQTGSTGEGIGIAKKLGHSVVSLRPGLVPLETGDDYPKKLEGLTLKNIRLNFSDGKRRIISEIGELLFTAFGISGPLVLTLSSKVSDWIKEGRQVYAEVDLKPALSKEQLSARISFEFRLNPKKSLKNTLKTLLPLRLIDLFIEIAKIGPDKKVSQVSKLERESLVSLLKALRLGAVKTAPIEVAMVTRGGVSLKDINPRTMESRRIKGLYFCGEMIDIDADTGGFNLQAAFSTGYLAGESAALN
ncbi:MAG: NAD(P)/FAD-dependent oxidoreductase [Candidatus Omnitrophota bacterium]